MKNLDNLFSKYHIDQLTNGCSTGNNWFGSGEVIESISPVDGNLIREISVSYTHLTLPTICSV